MKPVLGFVVALAIVGSAACAQEVERTATTQDVRTVVVIDGEIVKDDKGPAVDSGLSVNARVESGAVKARRDAVDLLNGGGTGTQPLVVAPKTETVVAAKRVVSETASKNASACVQIGVIGAQKDCRPK